MRRPNFSSLSGRRVFITGAASGIGRATAIAAGAAGAQLFLTDIDAGGLQAAAAHISAAGGDVRLAKPADISDYDEVAALGDQIHAEGAPMDVVMNIAGVAVWGTVENLQHRHWKKSIDVNLMGPIHVIETFLPPMIAAGHGGHLVNISSAAGLIGIPWHAPYSASKFGVLGISEVLRFDLRRHGIGVSVICPGTVSTSLTDSIEVAGIDKDSPEFGKIRARFHSHAVTPEHAAASILRAVRRNTYLVYTSNDIRIINQLHNKCHPIYVLAMRGVNALANRTMPMPTPAASVDS
jgi:NAD(P)-dependent dehydrogenase (short-subunit alcohol dehydrogenase family)